MCCTLFQGLGIDGSWFNIRPHGNAKGVEQFLGQINPQAKSIAFDLFDQNWTVTEVKNHMSKLDDPLKIWPWLTWKMKINSEKQQLTSIEIASKQRPS